MTLLFVCHANICRSPMAERLARLAMGDAAGLATASAGTHAHVGQPMHPGAAAALREVGADPDGFASRLVTIEDLDDATLVLTATRRERAVCATLRPTALGRTFTLRQFGRLARATTPSFVDGQPSAERVEALLREIALVRGTLQPVPPDEDDLDDPVNGTLDDVRACVDRIHEALAPWVALVR